MTVLCSLWSWKGLNFMVVVVIWTVLHGYVPGCLKFHSSIEYFGNSTWYMVLEGLKFTDLLFILKVFYTVMVLECLEFHRSIVVLLLHWYEWSCNGWFWQFYESWWVLWWLFSLFNGGGMMKWNVMHWLTCGLGRGSPASVSLTLSGWSSAVTSANDGLTLCMTG